MQLLRSRKKRTRGVFHLHLVSLAFIFSSLFSRFVIRRNDVWSTSRFLSSFLHSCLLHTSIAFGSRSETSSLSVKEMTKKEFKSCISDQELDVYYYYYYLAQSCSQTVILTPFSSTHSFLKVLLSSNEFPTLFHSSISSWYIFRDVCQREGRKGHHTNQRHEKPFLWSRKSLRRNISLHVIKCTEFGEKLGFNG